MSNRSPSLTWLTHLSLARGLLEHVYQHRTQLIEMIVLTIVRNIQCILHCKDMTAPHVCKTLCVCERPFKHVPQCLVRSWWLSECAHGSGSSWTGEARGTAAWRGLHGISVSVSPLPPNTHTHTHQSIHTVYTHTYTHPSLSLMPQQHLGNR